jgi:hypothetical protein
VPERSHSPSPPADGHQERINIGRALCLGFAIGIITMALDLTSRTLHCHGMTSYETGSSCAGTA